jgi:hypothetical protein
VAVVGLIGLVAVACTTASPSTPEPSTGSPPTSPDGSTPVPQVPTWHGALAPDPKAALKGADSGR